MTNIGSLFKKLVLFCLVMGFLGCGRLERRVLIDEGVLTPEKKAVVFFVDGVDNGVYREMLAGGELPNISEFLVERGVQAKALVTSAPSITYAITTTLVTGMTPGHHGILGNKYFDRERLFYADYGTTGTYRDTDNDYQVENIYEILSDHFSVSIQTPIRRGVYREIDNWASSGIRWFFDQIPEIDCLVAERFELVGELARRSGRWPGLIFAYFPAADEMGHRYGPGSERYRSSLRNADEQIGRICRVLEVNGLLESTYLLFVSDHGMAACEQENYIDLAEILAKEFSLVLAQDGPGLRTRFNKRVRYFDRYDAVLAQGGNRQAKVYLRNGVSWLAGAPAKQVRPIAERLVKEEAVCVAVYQAADGVAVVGAEGWGLIERKGGKQLVPLDEKEYRYEVIEGRDPLGYVGDLQAVELVDGEYHTGREWLESTVDSEYPDFVVQMVEMFDSVRAGDMVVFAADGWDFAKANIGGHGSVRAGDMLAPLVWAGPGIGRGEVIGAVRAVDVAPTLIDLMDSEELDGRYFDGISLKGKLEVRR